jgi:hypothetical protein
VPLTHLNPFYQKRILLPMSNPCGQDLSLFFFTRLHIDIRNTIYDIRPLPVHCLDHILIALHKDTFFDLEGGSEGAILNVELLADD